MRTLFSENILSPSPAPVPRPNPFELLLPSSAPAATSPSASVQSSPRQHEWLTQYSQSQQPVESDETAQSSYESNGPRPQYTLRKGNPRLLFMGLRKSGKTSVQKVVFQKMSPADTLFLEPTTRIETDSLQSFVTIETAELPTQLSATLPTWDHHALFSNVGAVIWVLDIQDEYLSSIASLIETAVLLVEHHPRIAFEVFIHKTDGLSDEYKHDTFREVRQRVQDELSDLGHGDRSVSYYQTSIFDHSVFGAMSKVVQKLLPQLPAMETLLNKLCSTCRIQKAYLFDTGSKIYVATDASPTFLKDYEVCSDYVDVVADIKQIYGWQGHGRARVGEEEAPAGGESMVTYDQSGDTYVYLREIDDHLSLLCVMGKGSSVDKRVLIDYNVGILQQALLQVFKV
ncbi:GTP-binding protein gtr2 [Friedmanniomyces endolithicus]|nr:GTP-binding protein gtr2 [Friedmanniomyces endolithicus]